MQMTQRATINAMIASRRKRNKFGARKTVVDGITFDSSREAQRYAVLKIAEKMGQIERLELQPKFDLIVNGQKICTYKADFVYFEKGRRIVEDCKGMPTAVYKLKRKLMKALYNIEVWES